MEDSDDGSEGGTDDRSTAPQSDYTNREVGLGLAIALVGILLVFVVPVLLA